MINVGEQLVSSYLRYIRECEFTQVNLYTVGAQGEIDVVCIDLKDRKLYVCEVAVHLTTGLQYVKDKRPNNINKLTEKFSRDIECANKYLPTTRNTTFFGALSLKAGRTSRFTINSYISKISAPTLTQTMASTLTS